MTDTGDGQVPVDSAALHKLTAWLSPLYPVGSFAYSHGLEQAVAAADVTDAGTLRDWIAACLSDGAGRNDAILLAAAWRAEDNDLAAVNDLALALAASSERHLETVQQGTAFVKTTGAVWDSETDPLAYPVAVGREARRHGIALEPTISLYLHAFAANLVSAGIRLIPLGQTDGQRVLAALFDAFDAIAAEAAGATLDDIGGCAFRSDLSSMAHETLHTRLFRS